MSNAITLELGHEDYLVLRELVKAVNGLTTAVAAMSIPATRAAVEAAKTAEAEAANQPPKPPVESPTAEKKPDLPVEEPVHQDQPVEVKPADPEPEAKPVELSEFQKAITTKLAAHPELKAQLKALVNEYARNVSGVPAEKRAEVMARWAKM